MAQGATSHSIEAMAAEGRVCGQAGGLNRRGGRQHSLRAVCHHVYTEEVCNLVHVLRLKPRQIEIKCDAVVLFLCCLHAWILVAACSVVGHGRLVIKRSASCRSPPLIGHLALTGHPKTWTVRHSAAETAKSHPTSHASLQSFIY